MRMQIQREVRRANTHWAWYPINNISTTCSAAAWTQEVVLVDPANQSVSAGVLQNAKSVIVKRLLINLGAVIVTATANTLYRLIFTLYKKDRDDTSVYNVNGATPFATDADERIYFQDTRDVFSPAAATYGGIDQSNPWNIDRKVRIPLQSDERLIAHFWCGKMTPGWGALTGVDQVTWAGHGRIGVEGILL